MWQKILYWLVMHFGEGLKKKSKLTLPHPEELPDYTRTIDNIFVPAVMEKWFAQWQVPAEYHNFWRSKVVVEVKDTVPYHASGVAAATAWEKDGVRYVVALPAWFNAGVLAHEASHVSYGLLTDKEKSDFAILYSIEKERDPLIKYLYSINNYGLTSVIEGHAEIYRYLGIEKMPIQLIGYYPKLYYEEVQE